MASWWEGVATDFSDLPDVGVALQIAVRLLTAALLGGLLGLERQWMGKSAGLRTHMLVAMGSALFVIAALQSGMPVADVSRVIQGLATGVGFVGGGAIIKMGAKGRVQGLTTAASIWVAAGVGLAAGMGRQMTAILAAALAFVILAVLGHIERRLIPRGRGPGTPGPGMNPEESPPARGARRRRGRSAEGK